MTIEGTLISEIQQRSWSPPGGAEFITLAYADIMPRLISTTAKGAGRGVES